MTLSINFESSEFIKPYSDLYSSGSLDLENVTKIFEKNIAKVANGENLGETVPFDRAAAKNYISDYKRLYRSRNFLKLNIDAKNDYYNNTIFGQIDAFIQFFFQKIGFKTPIEKAQLVLDNYENKLTKFDKQTLNKCETILNEKSNKDPSEKIDTNRPKFKSIDEEAEFLSFVEMSSIRALAKGETYIHCVGEKTNPSHIMFAKPNGDVYVLPRHNPPPLAKGTSRALYKGYLYTPNEPPKEIAILTTLPHINFGMSVNTVFQKDTFEDIKREHKLLQDLKDKNGIVPYDDFFTTTFCGQDHKNRNGNTTEFDCAFAMMDLYKLGDLKTFLNPGLEKGAAPVLPPSAKLSLMKSLSQTVHSLYKQGKIHRDIKDKNILPYFDDKDGDLKAKLIDFERCIDSDDNVRKKEGASTLEFWSPEYLDAMIDYEINNQSKESEQKLAEATTPAMDMWALGLVYYRIWYGEDLLEKLVKLVPVPGYSSMPNAAKEKAIKEQIHTNIKKAFPEEIDSVGNVIMQMLDPNPRTRITANELNYFKLWEDLENKFSEKIIEIQ